MRAMFSFRNCLVKTQLKQLTVKVSIFNLKINGDDFYYKYD